MTIWNKLKKWEHQKLKNWNITRRKIRNTLHKIDSTIEKEFKFQVKKRYLKGGHLNLSAIGHDTIGLAMAYETGGASLMVPRRKSYNSSPSSYKKRYTPYKKRYTKTYNKSYTPYKRRYNKYKKPYKPRYNRYKSYKPYKRNYVRYSKYKKRYKPYKKSYKKYY